MENFAHGSDWSTFPYPELGIISGQRIPRLGMKLAGTTCAVLKPRAVRSMIGGRGCQRNCNGKLQNRWCYAIIGAAPVRRRNGVRFIRES
jgi:hypothetical protein